MPIDRAFVKEMIREVVEPAIERVVTATKPKWDDIAWAAIRGTLFSDQMIDAFLDRLKVKGPQMGLSVDSVVVGEAPPAPK